jgi:hypothetical protein
MPKIKNASRIDLISLFENPYPDSNTIYIEGEGYDKNTLAPKFNSSMYFYPGEYQTYDFGSNYVRYSDPEPYNMRSGDHAGTMCLTKPVATTNQNTYGSSNNPITNIEPYQHLSMDDEIIGSPLRKVEDGNGNTQVYWIPRSNNYNWYRVISWYNQTKEFHEMQPDDGFGYDGQTNTGEIDVPIMATIKEDISDFVSVITQRVRYSTYSCRPVWGVGRVGFSAASNSVNFSTTMRDSYYIQYVGKSQVDNKPIYLYNHRTADYLQYVTKHNVSLNTTTDLHAFTVAPTAAGTNYGGATSTNVNTWSSKTFDDPTSAGNKCWYTPYFDSNGNFHPFFYQWDMSTDVFTRNSDITVTGDLSSAHMSNFVGVSLYHAGMASSIYNETFVSGGNRYITVIPAHGGYQAHDASPSARTIVSYAIDAADPKSLTHHSAITVPTTIRNTVWLNDSRTILGVICAEAFYIYNWNNTDGWVLTSTIAEKFTAVGRDSTDRIWATQSDGNGTYVNIHVLTPSIPVRITITPALSTYNYTGANINSTVAVSAYNINGDRIAVDVGLSITGSTMTFSAGATTTTVTTSTTADVSVPIVITGAGLSDIVANVQV